MEEKKNRTMIRLRVAGATTGEPIFPFQKDEPSLQLLAYIFRAVRREGFQQPRGGEI